MDFDLQWFLIALPLAFALGWGASRFDQKQFRRDRSEATQGYIKGLKLLLNEEQDKAIDAFIEVVQGDPDTTELHFALGNLFRRRGEVERAVRVHEHLLRRGDLSAADRERARRELALDYMKAGLVDRAEQAWQGLLGTPFDGEARLSLLTIYERSRDWKNAIAMAGQLEHSGAASFAVRIAHHECELALEADAKGHGDEAQAALTRALAVAPDAARPLVLLGQRHLKQGAPEQALAAWNRLRTAHPLAMLLVADDYARAANACQQAEPARQMLADLFASLPAVELLHALGQLDSSEPHTQMSRLLDHLAQHPSLSALQILLDQDPAIWGDKGLAAMRLALRNASRPSHRYRCAACGFEAQNYFWQCPGCLSWDSYPTQRVDAL